MPLPLWAVMAGADTLLNIGSNIFGQHKQQDANMELAKFQADANQKYLQQQLEYNTPKNQMARFQEAGLNPNLIYGQGNPGNQNAPLTHPDIRPTDFQNLMKNVTPVSTMMQTQASVGALNARTAKDVMNTEVARVQKAVLERNPLLDASYLEALIQSMQATANLKASDASIRSLEAQWQRQQVGRVQQDGSMLVQPEGFHKMDVELNLLYQKYHLNEADNKLKAAVLQSKEFQNDILNIQKKFIADGEVNYQVIMTFLLQLLQKL